MNLHSCVSIASMLTMVLSSLMTTCVEASDWVELSPMQVARGEHGNAVVGGQLYVIGGIFNSTSGPPEIERFDPATNQWSIIDTFPEERHRHHITIGSAVYGDEIWIVGGKTGGDLTGKTWVDVYNTTTGEWREGPDVPEILWGGPTVIVGDTLHAFAGAQGRNDTKNFHFSLDLTDPNATWQNKKKVPRPRVHAAGAAVGDKIYMIGGEFHHLHDGDTNTVQIYDTLTDTWSFGANVPLKRSHSEWATFAHNGQIWSISGVDSSNAPNRGQSEIFIYDPAADQWDEFLPELPVDLVSPGAKIIDDTLYVFGGGENDWFGGDMNKTYALTLPDDGIGGDFNGDGSVNGTDYLFWQQGNLANPLDASDLAAWQTNYGTPIIDPSAGDFDADGSIDGADFLQWQRLPSPDPIELSNWLTNYGTTVGPLPTSATIPEPSTLMLITLAGSAVFYRGSRQASS